VEVGEREGTVVSAVVDTPGERTLIVDGSVVSTVTGFVLASVGAPRVVIEAVVLVVVQAVVALVVTLVGATGTAGRALVWVGPTVELIQGPMVVDGGGLVNVVSVEGLVVEDVSQNRAVIEKGTWLVLSVLGPRGLGVELGALVVLSVLPSVVEGKDGDAFTVDTTSTTSGLTAVARDGVEGVDALVPSGVDTAEEVLGRTTLSVTVVGTLAEVVRASKVETIGMMVVVAAVVGTVSEGVVV
jgi:hypothetical protein